MSLDRPRLRRDLLAVAVEAEGQRYVDVEDPSTGSSFRLYDFEYHVALAFDGLAYETIVPWLKLACGIEITPGQLRDFAVHLQELGFLEAEPEGSTELPPSAAPPTSAPSATRAPEVGTDEVEPPAPALQPAEAPSALPDEGPDQAAGAAPAETPPLSSDPVGEPSVVPHAPELAAPEPPPPEAELEPTRPPPEAVTSAPPPEVAAAPAAEEATVTKRLEIGILVDLGSTPEPVEPPDEKGAAAAEPPQPPPPAADFAPGDLANVVVIPQAPVAPMRTWPAPYLPASDVVVSPAQTVADLVRASIAASQPPPPERDWAPDPGQAPADAAVADRGEPPAATVAEPATAMPTEAPAEVEAAATDEGARQPAASEPLVAEAEHDTPALPAIGLPAEVSPAPSVEARTHALDSTAFPVLPTPPPQPEEPPRPVTPVVVMPLVVTPPRSSSSRMLTPPPYVTPAPSTLGPLPVAVRRRQRRTLLLFGSLGVLTAAAVLAISLPFFFPRHAPARTNVRTVVATPGTVFRYFAGAGAVTPLPGPVLKLPAAGKVIRIAKPGTAVAVGDVLAAVESAHPLLNQLAHQRERLAFYQQMAEGMHQAGNTVEEERQARKVEERRARVAKTLTALGELAVVAHATGVVDETFTREGETVEAGSLALRLASSGHRAVFDLPSAQAAEARRLGFCQIGVDGYVFDCVHTEDRTDDGRISVELSALPRTLVGRPARLARARFEAAVVLPASAVLAAGRRHQVYVVSPSGRVEARPVTVAEQTASEAIILQGLDAGDNVVVEPPAELHPGAPVAAQP